MPDRHEEQALRVLLQQYPQLKAPHLSRRALLAASSLLAGTLAACGGGGGNSTTSSNTPAPTITGLSPSNGGLAGGTVVTINGTNLTGTTAVMFGTTAASSFTMVSSTQITATTPAHAMGSVVVSVTTPGGTTTSTTSFVYANSGVVSTFAGSGNYTFADGTGTAASFRGPAGVAVDSSGNVYVAESDNNMIRMITSAGVVSTMAGQGLSHTGSANGTGTAASFNAPYGVAVDNSGNVYVADTANNMIRMITSAGVVSIWAGSGSYTPVVNGTATAASFSAPYGVAVDSSGNVYVADNANNMIRKITATGMVSTWAGSGSYSPVTNGTGTAANFRAPGGVAVDSSGNVYVADTDNHLIRKITSAGVVSTWAGQGHYSPGSADGTGTAASFNGPWGVAVDSSGNVYVADTNNNMVRMITPAAVVTTLAGSGMVGSANGTGTAASFSAPQSVAVDSSGNVYVADRYNNMIRKIT